MSNWMVVFIFGSVSKGRLNKQAQSISVIADIAIDVICASLWAEAVFTLNPEAFTLKTPWIFIQTKGFTR
jgi:hypothetical protein